MAKKDPTTDREELLADIAEMYYQEGKTQAEISRLVGMTRSAISRILTEARQKGIVEIHVHRPLRYNSELEGKLQNMFNLIGARVINCNPRMNYEDLKIRLGSVAAIEMINLVKPGMVIGVAWGTTIKDVIDAFEGQMVPNIQVVQLLGVLGSTRHSYSAQSLVENLAQKLGGTGTYLYTPFIVDLEETAKTLKNDLSIKEAIAIAKQSDLAVLGIGSTKPSYCSLYQGKHITSKDLDTIVKKNAVGDVVGYYFDINGSFLDVELHKRLIGISKDDLLNIRIRFATAGHIEKAEAILGALRGKYVNYLVTDNLTAARILELAEENAGK